MMAADVPSEKGGAGKTTDPHLSAQPLPPHTWGGAACSSLLSTAIIKHQNSFSTQEQRQEDLCEFKASLIHIVSSKRHRKNLS